MTDQIVMQTEALEITPTAEAPPPVLITEGEVLLASAAVLPARPAKVGFLNRFRAMFAGDADESRGPARRSYLDNSVMSREMHRL